MVGPFADPFQVPFETSDLIAVTTASDHHQPYPLTSRSDSNAFPILNQNLFSPTNPQPQSALPLAPDLQQNTHLSDVLASAAQWDEIQDLQRELQRTIKERDEARMTVSTLRNEVYAARQTEKRLRAERDEARGQVAYLKKERASGRATEARLRRERDAARVAAVKSRGRGVEEFGKELDVDFLSGSGGSPLEEVFGIGVGGGGK